MGSLDAIRPRRGIVYRQGRSGRAASSRVHAATRVNASRTGRNVRALCGASILPATSIDPAFVPRGPDACPACSSALESIGAKP